MSTKVQKNIYLCIMNEEKISEILNNQKTIAENQAVIMQVLLAIAEKVLPNQDFRDFSIDVAGNAFIALALGGTTNGKNR